MTLTFELDVPDGDSTRRLWVSLKIPDGAPIPDEWPAAMVQLAGGLGMIKEAEEPTSRDTLQ